MSALTVKDGVSFKAFTTPLLRILGALEMIASQGRTLVPGLPDELVIMAVSESGLGLDSRSFANVACRQQFVWELKARLGPLFDVFLDGEGTPQERFTARRKAQP
jgi:hypothetical protein